MSLKNYLFTPLILTSILFFSACADKDKPESKAKDIADKMCKIASDIGITDINLDDISNEDQKRMGKKAEQQRDEILTILEEVDKYIKTLDKDQKILFTKELMKAIIDSDCSNTLMKNIPFDKWDEFYEEARRELKRDRKEEERRDREEEERRVREEAEQIEAEEMAPDAAAPYAGEDEF